MTGQNGMMALFITTMHMILILATYFLHPFNLKLLRVALIHLERSYCDKMMLEPIPTTH